ncbi:MAG: hypothetical protein L0H63_08645, partial [Nitrococcus sp.]|nr:hypothetical protein [Nitrococcus sp.]
MGKIHLFLMGLALVAASALCGGATARPLTTGANAGSGNLPAKAVRGGDADQQGLTLTVYQNGLGLVHAVRWVTLSPASLELTLSDLP